MKINKACISDEKIFFSFDKLVSVSYERRFSQIISAFRSQQEQKLKILLYVKAIG